MPGGRPIGTVLSTATKLKMRTSHLGKHYKPRSEAAKRSYAFIKPSWTKENTARNKRIHYWLRKTFGIPDHCDLCGKGRLFCWGNRDGIYEFDPWHWWQLCHRCNGMYDRAMDKIRHGTQ